LQLHIEKDMSNVVKASNMIDFSFFMSI